MNVSKELAASIFSDPEAAVSLTVSINTCVLLTVFLILWHVDLLLGNDHKTNS
jgi:hypothetical protein